MDKLNLTIDLDYFDCDNCGNSAVNFIDTVLDRMAIILLNQGGYLDRSHYDLQKELDSKINSITKKIENELSKQVEENFKKSSVKKITLEVENNIKAQVLKTKSIREIKQELEIKSDDVLNSELRKLISDIVVSEVKKMIKL